MRIKHINKNNVEKIYEYDTTGVMLLKDTRDKIKQLAKFKGQTIMTYMEKLINREHKKIK